MQTKKCKKCGDEKQLSEYHKSNRCSDGYRGVCKACNGNAGRARYEKSYKGGMGHNQGRVEIPSQERLHELFRIDGANLVRRVSSGNCKAGSLAGTKMKGGYRRVWVDGAHALVHRIVWKMVTGEEPPKNIDHINGDTSDNRIENMRDATHGQNMQNQRLRKSNTSGFTGIRWYDYPYTGKAPCWTVNICIDGKAKHIGYFDDIADAIISYERAARLHHGIYADRKIAHNRSFAAKLGIKLED